ncbi:hypothetical protein AN641_07970 [Candidatus Epulonipiscioides gigas]|nr:hypothetical protein AN641_07970 [Epulopiscium sp. SCG-C07WGA-EpuloA2]
MVTIEQKLALFSKLMQQDISDNLQEGRQQIESEYKQKKIQQEKQVKEQAKNYVNDHKKIIDTKITQYKAKEKINSKKEVMKAKEECINIVYEELRDKINSYTDTSEYQNWLKNKLQSLKPLLINTEEPAKIYLTQKDLKNQKDALLTVLPENSSIEFETNNKIELGGLILRIESSNMQIDLSLDSILNNKSEEISQVVISAIEKECVELGD